MRNNLKIGLCQMNVVDNKELNIKKAISMIKEGKENGIDIAILPEMFNCPYENEKFIEYAEKKEESPTLNAISELADKLNLYILAGSIPEKKENKIYNSSYFFDNNGKIIANHKKMHLFDIDVPGKIRFMESDTLSAGNNFTIANTPFGKIGMGICYDIRFVELGRILTLNGARILIYPGAFNLTTGPAHWELLFRSRALDNQVYTIGVAPALNKKANYNSFGHSIVASPWGDIIAECGYGEELKIVDINLNKINQVRKEIPILKNKRDDLYKVEKIAK
ncbi:carbon-nitrogen hydrolase [Methanobrevibacter sp. 87.7]|uniref:carbon-nitrogen hydrolase family protein n=1 Tax=Methanobrevibacter sp. 87.7 TaxID=387957 RepID=UPI000B506B95|nr:carbon-nitrogen hydrolase family protein [Methanobrevibacter sp. 87.7]OWT32858.1 carbon-nitrogen hydrolase [Methanobrevibacter sp. 87.7]